MVSRICSQISSEVVVLSAATDRHPVAFRRTWRTSRDLRSIRAVSRQITVRGKAINIDEYKLIKEVDKLPHEEHMKYEQDRMARCITYLKGMLDDTNS